MDPQKLEEFRRKLREGRPARVVNGEVVASEASEAPRAAEGKAPPPVSPQGVVVKPHQWGAAPVLATGEGAERVLKEQQLLLQEYPGFQMDVDEEGTPFASGVLGPNATLRQAYQVLLLLPPGYGHGALPQAFVLSPALRAGAPHRYSDGSLCLDHSGSFTRRSTLVTLLAWVTVWLCLYEGWLESGVPW